MYDINFIKGFIGRCQWIWARTYRNIPHEYIVRGKCGLSDDEFLYFVHAQRSMGIHERWGKYNHQYLYIDGYKYWTMGDTYDKTVIINRAKVFNELDILKTEPKLYYGEQEMQCMAEAVKMVSDGSILDIGCGDAPYAECLIKDKSGYMGIEASKDMTNRFRERHPLLKGRITCRPFEEVSGALEWFDIAVAMFGSASYIMRPYLNIIGSEAKDYFLMFYRDGFCPEAYKACHHFRYTASDISKIFPKGCIREWNDYLVCSSKDIDWFTVYECAYGQQDDSQTV